MEDPKTPNWNLDLKGRVEEQFAPPGRDDFFAPLFRDIGGSTDE